MLKNKHAWLIVLLTASGGVWACSGDDTDSPTNTNTGGQGGEPAAGKSGGGSSSAGSSTVGGGGRGGTSSAGTAGTVAGESSVGGAGAGGAGAPGSMGGAPVGEAGAPGAAGQAGAPGVPTLADNCATVCAAQAGLACSYGADCVTGCLGTADPDIGTIVPDEYAAMIACEANSLQDTDYECSAQSMGPDMPAAKAATACETLICKFTCDDGIFIDENTFGRCGC